MVKYMKKINFIFMFITMLLTILYVFFYYNNISLSKYLIIISFIPIFVFVRIISKYLKLSEYLQFIIILFVFVSIFLGSILEFYSKVYFYDKLVHLLSGVLTGVLAIKILNKLNIKGNVINIIFIIIFSLAVAVSWELFEYFSDLILKGDVQHVLTTGINDTMTDVISALLGCIIFSILTIKTNKKLI